MRVALVRDGVVENIASVKPEHFDSISIAWSAMRFTPVVSDTAEAGDLYDGKVFTRPPDTRTLADVKQARFADIDRRTDEIIALGYEYPPKFGVRYSTSIESQTRILGLMIAAASMPPSEWPVPWNSLDDTACAQLAGPADVQLMYACGMAWIKGAVLSGTEVKEQVRQAATIEDVEAVRDGR